MVFPQKPVYFEITQWYDADVKVGYKYLFELISFVIGNTQDYSQDSVWMVQRKPNHFSAVINIFKKV